MNLTGTLLISTPSMGDPRFVHSIIYLCAHGADGAFGLVLNRPVPKIRVRDVLSQLEIIADEGIAEVPVLAGGPVETQRGFVLHAADGDAGPDTQALPEGLALSASTDMLRAIARGSGPSEWLLALGYAGWGAGQLEDEIGQNAWLTCKAPHGLIFDPAPGEHQWRGALKSMGIDPLSLSTVAGRA
ncbi:MAG: YqgE/AlgH family protein [Paracoccaceae bacterium]